MLDGASAEGPDCFVSGRWNQAQSMSMVSEV